MNVAKQLEDCKCGTCADCKISKLRSALGPALEALEEIALGTHCSACSCACHAVANGAAEKLQTAMSEIE
jgi:hypothetical protein